MTHANMTPYTCPVCQGRGTMPSSFYTPPMPGVHVEITTSGGPVMEKCRACDNGVVWSMEIISEPTIEVELPGFEVGDDLSIPIRTDCEWGTN